MTDYHKALAALRELHHDPEVTYSAYWFNEYQSRTSDLIAAIDAQQPVATTKECGGQVANPVSLVTPHSSHDMGAHPVVVPFAPRNGAPNTTPPPETAEQLAWIEWKHEVGGSDWTAEDSFDFRVAFVAGYRAAKAPPAASCVCGDQTLGVVHRADGPCYMPDMAPPTAMPEGYVLVPVEPTEAMLDEGGKWTDAYAVWAAMLAAAQAKENNRE